MSDPVDFKAPLKSGSAAKATPRQILMYALQRVDDMDAVLVVGFNRTTQEIHGFYSTANALERDGLAMTAIKGRWPEGA